MNRIEKQCHMQGDHKSGVCSFKPHSKCAGAEEEEMQIREVPRMFL